MKDLPSKCDSCGANFSVGHSLSFKKCGLVIGRHNEFKDELAYLATLATNPRKILDEPLIHISHNKSRDDESEKLDGCIILEQPCILLIIIVTLHCLIIYIYIYI